MALESPPLAEQGAAGYNAEQFRRGLFFGLTTPGVKTQGAWLMSAPASGMSVNNALGEGIIPGTIGSTQGEYYGLGTSQTNTAVAAANPTNPRIDLDCGTVDDAAYSGAANDWKFQVVTGTPTAGATLANLNGAPALPSSSLLCGYILVPANASSIVAADLLDERVLYGPPPDPVFVPVTTTVATATSGTFYKANANSGSFTITLPAPTANQVVGVMKTDSSANTVTINASTNSGSISGPGLGSSTLSTLVLATQGASVLLQSDGATWWVVSSPQGILAPPAAFSPSNPSSTTSTSGVMMGLGSTISYTPRYTGTIKVTIAGVIFNGAAAAYAVPTPKFGSGAAPPNGFAVTGNSFGGYGSNGSPHVGSENTTSAVGWYASDRRTGLTPGTAYWFDVELATGNASDPANIENVVCLVEECL